jgi:hypothetical protein
MKNAKGNFTDPLRSFLTSANKTLFAVKDLYSTILYFYICLPQSFKDKLATDHEVIELMIQIYVQFVENIRVWNLSRF